MVKQLACLLIVFAVLGIFMALDKTVGHWYAPEEMDAEVVARQLLGRWDKTVPQSVRDDHTERWLAGQISISSGDTSAEQLSTALSRIANAAALPLVSTEIARLSTPREKLDRLDQCIGYLLGTTDTIIACNMQWIR